MGLLRKKSEAQAEKKNYAGAANTIGADRGWITEPRSAGQNPAA
jgi:hypothetical protein